MDANRIEALLALASAKTSCAHRRVTVQMDFTAAGMKALDETREFLTELQFARYEIAAADRSIAAIQAMYEKARRLGE